ncbi:hypothetical protein [Rhodoferax sp.]|uniref:hypothetical protein n=1 Tax=Rhodoferax sp. TaxID=50421 RepID=UPI002771291F|nr:hypothetical protein [Rhodoferax sp.]
MSMRELTYQVSFNTPAFLGNAEQQAQWRTPPFKALLRQWWRVVKAPAREVGYDHKRLLVAENGLFGSALDGDGSSRSKVQLRLSAWDEGAMNALQPMARHPHPEVKDRDRKPIDIATAVYLGFGPVTLQGMRKAIAPVATPLTFKVRCPELEIDDIRNAIQLIAWFGTVGSRSRNAWGSVRLEGEGILGIEGLCDSKLSDLLSLRTISAALGDRLAGEWPHSMGLCADGRPAVWRVVSGQKQVDGKTQFVGFDKWEQVLERFAALKIGFRTQFSFNNQGGPHRDVMDRHVLAYPVTNHGLANLPNARLASQIRFKVIANKEGKFFGVIAHVPAAMPRDFFYDKERQQMNPPSIADQVNVWNQVHQFLNTPQPGSQVIRIRKG